LRPEHVQRDQQEHEPARGLQRGERHAQRTKKTLTGERKGRQDADRHQTGDLRHAAPLRDRIPCGHGEECRHRGDRVHNQEQRPE
jgi:hypothetical protein